MTLHSVTQIDSKYFFCNPDEVPVTAMGGVDSESILVSYGTTEHVVFTKRLPSNANGNAIV